MSRREQILGALVVVLAGLLAAALVARAGGLGEVVGRVPVLGPMLVGDAESDAGFETHGEPEPEYWTCSMHTSVHREHAGTCPICSMDLVPVYVDDDLVEDAHADDAEAPSSDMPGMPGMPGMSGPPPDTSDRTPEQRATFRVDATWQQAVGVRTATVQPRQLSGSLRLVGRVSVDETRLSDVNLRTAGWIERLHVDETGQRVRAGEALFDLYSPEMVTAQRDLLLAADNVERLAGSPSTEARDRARSLVDASRRRLVRLGLTESQVEAIASGGEIQETLPVLAPHSGYVIDKMAVEGMRVEPGMRLYQIADLGTVWVLVDVYEGDVSFVRIGQEAVFRLSYQREDAWRGRVDYVYPTLDPGSRTVRVRLVVPNPDLELRPDMYGDVTLRRQVAADLAIPAEAVIDLGTRQIVFVDLGQGRLQAREVALGPATDGWVPVRAGLALGETVVVSGNFLIDAESKVRGVVPLPTEGGTMQPPGAADPDGAPRAPERDR